MRRIVGVAVAIVFLFTSSLPAFADMDSFPTYTGDQFQALHEYAVANTLPNLVPPAGRLSVTGDTSLDARIWELAIARGYVLRPLAGDDLTRVDGVTMQRPAAEAWVGLKAAARAAGMRFIVSSAYRSPDAQRTQFNSKLRGTTDGAIEAALRWYSIPGTSKHHGGYALDFRHANGTFGDFRATPDFAWLSEDNYENAKRFGFIPSYPDDVDAQGPNPEPWEYVWVGVELIRCGIPMEASALRYGSKIASELLAETFQCPGATAPADLDRLLRRWGAKLESVLNF